MIEASESPAIAAPVPAVQAAGLPLLVTCLTGDPRNSKSWSGTPSNIVAALERLGIDVRTLNLCPSPSAKFALRVFSRLTRTGDFVRTPFSRLLSNRLLQRAAANSPGAQVLHMGTAAIPLRNHSGSLRHYVYCDSTFHILTSWNTSVYRPTALKRLSAGEHAAFHKAEHVFAVSEYVRKDLIDHYGLPASRITVTGTGRGGIEPFFGPKDRSIGTILFVAKERFEEKGGVLLLDGFRKAATERSDLRLIMVAQAEYRELVQSVPNTEFHTSISWAHLGELFRRASVFAMPARYEPWGLVYLEAMASGCVLIGADRNAMPEFTGGGKFGFLIRDFTPEAVADTILEAFSDRDRLERMANHAQRNCLEKYSWDNVASLVRGTLQREEVAGSLPPPAETPDVSSHLLAKYFSGWLSAAISGVVTFGCFRLYLQYLGVERYGLWLLLATVLTVVQLGSIGLAPALIRLVAHQRTSEGHGAIQRYLLMSVSLVTLIGLAITALILGNSRSIISILHLPTGLSGSFRTLLPYMTILSVYAMIVDLFLATLSGLGRIDRANYAQLCSQIAGTLASVVLLRAGFGLKSLVFGAALSLILLHALIWIHICRIMPLRLPSLGDWNTRELRKLLGFGGWVTGTTLANACIGPATRILLARYTGLAAVPVYDLAFGAAYKLRSVWECAMRALLPEVSRVAAADVPGKTRELADIYWKAVRILLAGATPLYAVVFVCAAPILQIWLGPGGGTNVTTLRILLAAAFVNLIGVPSYYFLMAIGEVRHCFVASTLMAAVSIGCAGIAIHYWATLPVAIASASFLVGTSCLTIYLSWQVGRTLTEPQSLHRRPTC